ncbi:hypothetical protein PMIN02_009860 [Paraphaeosphaeria minitans]
MQRTAKGSLGLRCEGGESRRGEARERKGVRRESVSQRVWAAAAADWGAEGGRGPAVLAQAGRQAGSYGQTDRRQEAGASRSQVAGRRRVEQSACSDAAKKIEAGERRVRVRVGVGAGAGVGVGVGELLLLLLLLMRPMMRGAGTRGCAWSTWAANGARTPAVGQNSSTPRKSQDVCCDHEQAGAVRARCGSESRAAVLLASGGMGRWLWVEGVEETQAGGQHGARRGRGGWVSG